MSSNIQRLGETIAGRMKKTASAAVPTFIELGVINSNLSLTTDSLKNPIPRGSYMVNLVLNEQEQDTDTEKYDGGRHTHSGADHSHSDGEHLHNVILRPLKAGDRVLVAWCGHEPVVVAVVVSS